MDCVIDDVFAGTWSWNCPALHLGGDVLRGDVPLISGDDSISVESEVVCTGSAHGVCEVAATPRSLFDRRVRRVRFNLDVEIHEFEPDFEFLDVDDVITNFWAHDAGGSFQFHFSSEVDSVLPDPAEMEQDFEPIDPPGEEESDEEDPYVILHGFEQLRVGTLGIAVSDLEPLQVITYGIRGRSLGRRDTWVTNADLPSLRLAIWDLWENEVPQFGVCWAFVVRPQPLLELQVTRAWILLVEGSHSTRSVCCPYDDMLGSWGYGPGFSSFGS